MTALLLGGPLATACDTCNSPRHVPCFTCHGAPCRPHAARRRAAPPVEAARPGHVVVVQFYRDPTERLAVLVEIVEANLVIVRLWDGRLGAPGQMIGLSVVRVAPPGPERDAVLAAYSSSASASAAATST